MKNEMKFTGIISNILDVIQVGKTKKIEFIVTEEVDQYPQSVKFSIYGDEKVDKFEKFNKLNAKVDVSFNFRTTEWNEKHFTSIEAWKVFKAESVSAEPF